MNRRPALLLPVNRRSSQLATVNVGLLVTTSFMTTDPVEPITDVSSLSSPQAIVTEHIAAARALQRVGDEKGLLAIASLEEAMTLARAAPFEIEFQTRVDLALTLGDLYISIDDVEKARGILGEEASFAESIFQIMQASGTPEQKRAAAGGRVQVRDRSRQVALLGQAAPEIQIDNWISGEPATLAELRGRVILLEFWATWCKPCQQMFPKLKQLDEQYRDRGLDVIALTRHYFAGRDMVSSQAEELELMRSVVSQYEIEFRVGVAKDERIQNVYGATGMPALALVDRKGLVQYAHFGGGEDERFGALLTQCLDETV